MNWYEKFVREQLRLRAEAQKGTDSPEVSIWAAKTRPAASSAKPDLDKMIDKAIGDFNKHESRNKMLNRKSPGFFDSSLAENAYVRALVTHLVFGDDLAITSTGLKNARAELNILTGGELDTDEEHQRFAKAMEPFENHVRDNIVGPQLPKKGVGRGTGKGIGDNRWLF